MAAKTKKKSDPARPPAAETIDPRRGNSVEAIKQAMIDHLIYSQGRTPPMATRNEWYLALAPTWPGTACSNAGPISSTI